MRAVRAAGGVIMMAADDIGPSSDSFWEVDCYKRTVKRQDDGYKLCSELMNLINERGHIEKEYAKQLKGWSKKWTDLLDKGKHGLLLDLTCKEGCGLCTCMFV